MKLKVTQHDFYVHLLNKGLFHSMNLTNVCICLRTYCKEPWKHRESNRCTWQVFFIIHVLTLSCPPPYSTHLTQVIEIWILEYPVQVQVISDLVKDESDFKGAPGGGGGGQNNKKN